MFLAPLQKSPTFSRRRRRNHGKRARTHTMDVEAECKRLILAIERISTDNKSCTFGALFGDDEVQNEFEALNGTLRAAKKRKMIRFEGEMLLQGAHDHVVITIL